MTLVELPSRPESEPRVRMPFDPKVVCFPLYERIEQIWDENDTRDTFPERRA